MLTRVGRVLTENWGLKLAALGLAILLWMAVTANQPQRANFRNVRVEVDVRDPDWRLVRAEPSRVMVTVLGPKGELVSLSSNPPRILLPVERVSDDIEHQVVPVQWVQLPRGLRETRVLGLRPDTIRLVFERVESRTLPVQVQTTGDLPEGLALFIPISTNPSSVEVRGPARLLEEMDSVPLAPIDLSGLRSTTNVPTAVDTTAFEGVQFQPTEINVVLRVMPADSQAVLQPDSLRDGAPF